MILPLREDVVARLIDLMERWMAHGRPIPGTAEAEAWESRHAWSTDREREVAWAVFMEPLRDSFDRWDAMKAADAESGLDDFAAAWSMGIDWDRDGGPGVRPS